MCREVKVDQTSPGHTDIPCCIAAQKLAIGVPVANDQHLPMQTKRIGDLDVFITCLKTLRQIVDIKLEQILTYASQRSYSAKRCKGW